MTPDSWLEAHAYLRPVADLAAEIDRAAEAIERLDARIPDWRDYQVDFLAGVPLLSSADAAIDLEPGGRMAAALFAKLTDSLSGNFAEQARAVDSDLRRQSDAPHRVAAFLLGDDTLTSPFPGLLRYVGWTAMTRFLHPVVAGFGSWRDEERWLRRYCPTCGNLPAMAHLIGNDPGRMRYMVCGHCATHWRYGRTHCPFCETESNRLASLGVEGESGLRIDYCESCQGYLKTYSGQGEEAVLLADWTSLHLDVIARDRGLKRMAGSLFDLETA